MTVITGSEIADSGLPNIGEVIRTLPVDFSGGDNPGVIGSVGSYNGNSGGLGAYTANLRGIGNNSTLTLLDGQRLAYNGTSESVDMSLMPTIAVDRIEIDSGGASAIYGSDAVAGVMNIVPIKNYEGERTTASIQEAADGGGFRQQYGQLVGREYDHGSTVFAYEYDSSDSLRADQRSVSYSAGPLVYLEPMLRAHSAYLDSDYDFTETVQGSIEGVYTHREALNTEYPVSTAATTSEFGADMRLLYKFAGAGSVAMDITDAGAEQSASTNTVVSSIPFSLYQANQTKQTGIALSGSGTLLNLPAGELKIAAGGGFRRESLDLESAEATTVAPVAASRRVTFSYLELDVPLLRGRSGDPAVNSLTLNMAESYDHYSDFGGTANPVVGLRYSPLRAVTLKGTWGTSFRAPSLYELHGGEAVGLYPGFLWKLPQSNSEVLYDTGSNPDLKPETATTSTETVQYAPEFLGRMRFQVTYYDINYHGRISVPIVNPLAALGNPLYSAEIVMNPSAGLQSQAIAGAEAFGNAFGVPYVPADVAAIIYNRYANVASQNIDGIDADVRDQWDTAIGVVVADIDGTWLRFDQTSLPGTPPEPIAGVLFNPPRFKMRMELGWSRNAWSVHSFVNHIDGEQTFGVTPGARIGSWTTNDWEVSYEIPKLFRSGAVSKVSLAILNALNSAPPIVPAAEFVPPAIGYDAQNASALGRAFSLSAAVNW